MVQVLPLLYWSPAAVHWCDVSDVAGRCLRCLRCRRCLVRCLASRDDCRCSRPTSCWRHCLGLSHPGLLQFVTTLQHNQLPAPVTWNCRMYTAVALWEIYGFNRTKNTSKWWDIDIVSFDSMIKDAWKSTSRSASRMHKMAMKPFKHFNVHVTTWRHTVHCLFHVLHNFLLQLLYSLKRIKSFM